MDMSVELRANAEDEWTNGRMDDSLLSALRMDSNVSPYGLTKGFADQTHAPTPGTHVENRVLFGAKNAVTCIAQTRQDVAVLVQAAVNRGREYGYVGMLVVESFEALWTAHQTHKHDGPGLALLDACHGSGSRVACGEHGV
jgi:hypothetical protein